MSGAVSGGTVVMRRRHSHMGKRHEFRDGWIIAAVLLGFAIGFATGILAISVAK